MVCNKENTSTSRMLSLPDFTSQSRRKPQPGLHSPKHGIKRSSRPNTSNSKGFILSQNVTAQHLNAWIEHGEPVNAKFASAAEAAKFEEQRLQLHEREKKKRLCEFRQAVLERLKENVEKDRSSDEKVDDFQNLQDNKLHRSSPHRLRKNSREPSDNFVDHQNKSDDCKDALLVLSSEIEELSKGVREIMRNKIACTEAAALPGGLWYTSPTEDRDSIRHCGEFDISLKNSKEKHFVNKKTHQSEFPLSEIQETTVLHACKKVTFADRVTAKFITPERKPLAKTVFFQSAKPLNSMSESRKYYMDMERQKARQQTRMNHQREKLGRVKSQKEQERQAIEQQFKHVEFNRVTSDISQR